MECYEHFGNCLKLGTDHSVEAQEQMVRHALRLIKYRDNGKLSHYRRCFSRSFDKTSLVGIPRGLDPRSTKVGISIRPVQVGISIRLWNQNSEISIRLRSEFRVACARISIRPVTVGIFG